MSANFSWYTPDRAGMAIQGEQSKMLLSTQTPWGPDCALLRFLSATLRRNSAATSLSVSDHLPEKRIVSNDPLADHLVSPSPGISLPGTHRTKPWPASSSKVSLSTAISTMSFLSVGAYGNLTPCGSTLWVRVKRHAIHHRGSSMHRRLVENILLIVTNLCTVLQYSISLRTHQSMTSWCMSLISVDLNVVYWSVLHLILDSAWVWYSLLLELKITTLAWHWVCLLCLRHWEVYSLQVMRTQLKLLEKSLS